MKWLSWKWRVPVPGELCHGQCEEHSCSEWRVGQSDLPGLRFWETVGYNGQFHNWLFLEDKECYLSWSVSKLKKTEQMTHIFRVKIHEKNTHISEFHFSFTSDIISFQSEKYQSNVKGKAEMFPYSFFLDKKESAPSNQNSLHRTQK